MIFTVNSRVLLTYLLTMRLPRQVPSYSSRALLLWILFGLVILRPSPRSDSCPSPSALRSIYAWRLWWHLVFLDVESTIASGLPAIISSGSHNTNMPSIAWSDTVVGDEGNTLSSMMIAMQGHREWAYRMQIWYERKPQQHEIAYFNKIIDSLLKMVGDDHESEWARVYLEMLVDRAYCMLGLRFWQLDLFKGMDCHSEVVRYVYIIHSQS